MSEVYHQRMRDLQRRFGTEALADRLAERNRRSQFTEDDRAFIDSLGFFFLATCDAEGNPDCSHKGGVPGYLAVTGPSSLSFPTLDGNGMYRSLGNILANPRVGLLFIDMVSPRRLRVNGRAEVRFDDPRQAQIPGAEAMVHVDDVAIFSNCPRYIHLGDGESDYLDRGDGRARVPDWKRVPEFNEVLPENMKP